MYYANVTKLDLFVDNSQTTQTDAPIPRFLEPATSPATSRPKEITTPIIAHTSRGTEASALSAFLIPGGQVPSSGSIMNLRPLGRSTITKVASPYLGRNAEREQSRERPKSTDAQRNAEIVGETTVPRNEEFVVDENGKPTDNGPFNWYFQHYNDTNLEPYVGIVYSGVAKIGVIDMLLLLVLSILI